MIEYIARENLASLFNIIIPTIGGLIRRKNVDRTLTVRAWVDLTLLAPQKMITSSKF